MKITTLLSCLCFLAQGFATTLQAADPVSSTLPLEVRENLRIVYQVSDDTLHEGVNKGLSYARKLIDTYETQGIAAGEVHLHLVFHSSGIAALVNEAARVRMGAEAQNPNVGILAALIKRGVQIEICESTMKQKGIEAAELMPGVKMVIGAFPRLIDLQLQGFAYIKFE